MRRLEFTEFNNHDEIHAEEGTTNNRSKIDLTIHGASTIRSTDRTSKHSIQISGIGGSKEIFKKRKNHFL